MGFTDIDPPLGGNQCECETLLLNRKLPCSCALETKRSHMFQSHRSFLAKPSCGGTRQWSQGPGALGIDHEIWSLPLCSAYFQSNKDVSRNGCSVPHGKYLVVAIRFFVSRKPCNKSHLAPSIERMNSPHDWN